LCCYLCHYVRVITFLFQTIFHYPLEIWNINPMTRTQWHERNDTKRMTYIVNNTRITNTSITNTVIVTILVGLLRYETRLEQTLYSEVVLVGLQANTRARCHLIRITYSHKKKKKNMLYSSAQKNKPVESKKTQKQDIQKITLVKQLGCLWLPCVFSKKVI